MSLPVLASFHEQLHTCFEVLKVNKRIWEDVLAECSPLFSSLGNLSLQIEALKNVQLVNTPLAHFSSLQDRLLYKLLLAVDTVLRKLNEKVDALQTAKNTISQHVSAAFQFYEKNTETLDIVCCVTRSATCPSIADMLEWLQDADRHYRLQLLQRRNFLQMLTHFDLTLMGTAPKRWESLRSPSREERTAEALFQVSFFVENSAK